MTKLSPLESPCETAGAIRGTVDGIFRSGEILVTPAGPEKEPLICDFLVTGEPNRLRLELGDQVLVHLPAAPAGKGCVLGKIGQYQAPATDRIDLRASEEITIRCGDSVITLRANGDILINGRDIVSRAKRRNRVRGGSIQLN